MAVAASMVLGCALAHGAEGEAGPPRPPVEVTAAPPGCKSLGEVKGSCSSNPCGSEIARQDALNEARRMGATHVRVTWAGRYGAYTEIWKGIAYRCPAAPPVQGK